MADRHRMKEQERKSLARVFPSANNKKPARYPHVHGGTVGWSVPRYPWHGYKGICASLLNAPSLNQVPIISTVIVCHEIAILAAVFEFQGQP